MRFSASVALFLFTAGAAARAEIPAVTLDLPAGPLSAAIAALAARSGASIGTAEPDLLARRLPAVHASGSPARLVALLARRAGLRVTALGEGRWIVSLRRGDDKPRRAAPVLATPIGPDIVVEASKQGARLADLPATLVRVAGIDLASYGGPADTGALIARIPALGSTDWGSGHDKLFLRGIADSSFAGTGPALVGQYWGDQQLTRSMPDPNLRLYDVAAVEVLEGPQGTLYGAGALGGLIRVEPNAPSLAGANGWVAAGVASTAHGGTGRDGAAMLDLPIVDGRLGLRLVGYDALDAGYIDDAGRGLVNVNRVFTRGGRATLRWRPVDGWTVDLGAIGQRTDSRDAPYADVDAPPLTRSSRIAQPSYNQFLSGRIAVTGTIGGASLHSTTGVVDQAAGENYEVLQPFNSLIFVGRDRARLITHETRLAGRSDKRSWVVGVSVLSSVDREARYYGRIGVTPPPLATIDNAVFEAVGYGEVTQQIMPRLTATFGARVSAEWLSATAIDRSGPLNQFFASPPAHLSSSQTRLLPSAALSFRPVDGTTLFLRYGSGFRPGGLTAGDTVARFQADRLDSLEIGLRRGTPGRDRVALALSAATSWWRHVQADLEDGLGLSYITNIGDGRISSLDGSLTLMMGRGWQAVAAGFLTRNRLYPTAIVAAEGDADHLPNVARDGVSLSLDHAGTLAGHPWQTSLRVRHVGPSLLGIGPFLAATQGNYTTLGAGTTLRFGRLGLQINGENLVDSRHNAFAVGTPFAGMVRQQITPLRPRTIRFGIRYDF